MGTELRKVTCGILIGNLVLELVLLARSWSVVSFNFERLQLYRLSANKISANFVQVNLCDLSW